MTWQEVLTDKTLHNLPYKIELNRNGQIVMSPATNQHGIFQMYIGATLMQLLPNGVSISECSIETSQNVKVADVAWMSQKFYGIHKHSTPFLVAPEICVEIVSPSNTQAEMLEKKDLYLERGAKEVWFCNLKGELQFFDQNGQLEHSLLVERFPKQLEL